MSRLRVAFEKQFVRFINELCQLYPHESQLHTWRTALQVKQTLMPEETRELLFTHFREKVSIPYGTYVANQDEVGLLRVLPQHVAGDDGWFHHFQSLYLKETDTTIKQVMWQYMDNLHQLVCLDQPMP